MEGEANGTVLSEVQDGTSHNITCTVKSAKPAVTGLTIEPATGFNWKTVTDGVHSVTLVIDKATAVNNTRKFTCVAVNNVTTSKLVFNNFVGGKLLTTLNYSHTCTHHVVTMHTPCGHHAHTMWS